MKNDVYDYEPRPKTKNELEQILLIIWGNNKMKTINDLVLSFQNRLEMHASVFCSRISHLLSSGPKSIKQIGNFDNENLPYLLTNDENKMLMEKIDNQT